MITKSMKAILKAKGAELNISVTFPTQRKERATRHWDEKITKFPNGSIKMTGRGIRNSFSDAVKEILATVPVEFSYVASSSGGSRWNQTNMSHYKVWTKPALKESYKVGDTFQTSDQTYKHIKEIKFIMSSGESQFFINKGSTDQDEPEVYTQEGFIKLLNS